MNDTLAYTKLLAVQSELKAPKKQFNSFGKYFFRSAEDILEAVKPLLKTHGATVTITDDVVQVGERYYVKATVSFCADGNCITTTALAREEETKKGMDGSQITGSASSYARKYALGGMFAIDDGEDADSGKGAQTVAKSDDALELSKLKGEILHKLQDKGLAHAMISTIEGITGKRQITTIAEANKVLEALNDSPAQS